MLITQKIINELTYNIIGACIEVHKLVGPWYRMKQYIINVINKVKNLTHKSHQIKKND